jgi:hypothetical protein
MYYCRNEKWNLSNWYELCGKQTSVAIKPHFKRKSKPRTPEHKNNTTKQQLPTTHIHKDKNQNEQKHITYTTQKQKWATFTYTGRETRTITRLLKNNNIHIAHKTRNIIQNHLKPRNNTTDIYCKSGIYQMKCKDRQLKYVGQTGRNFRTRCKEHTQAIRTNKPSCTNIANAIAESM